MAQPQQHQPGMHQPVGDFLFAIYKFHTDRDNGIGEVWLVQTVEGTKGGVWSHKQEKAKLWRTEEEARQVIEQFIGIGDAGVRGIPVGC